MPTYLCHGFRWHRSSIRVYIAIRDLDDASAEWIVRKDTARALLNSFYGQFDFLPECAPPRPPRPSRSRSASAASALSKAHGHSQTRVRSRTRNGTASRSSSVVRTQEQQGTRSRAGTNASQRSGAANIDGNTTSNVDKSHTHNAQDDGFEDEPDEIEPEEEDAVLAQQWSPIRLLEEYDPRDLTSVSAPHAYVADHVVRVDVSASIGDEMGAYEEKLKSQQARWREDVSRENGVGRTEELPPSVETGDGWLERLRDRLQAGEKIGWYIVVNGDEERDWRDEVTPPASVHGAVANGNMDEAKVKARQKLRAEFGGEDVEIEPTRERDTRRDTKPLPEVPEKDVPVTVKASPKTPILGHKSGGSVAGTALSLGFSTADGGTNVEQQQYKQKPQPRMPKQGGFRRLFGRSRSSIDESHSARS